LGILQRNDDLRAWAFSKLCASMEEGAMAEARCSLLGGIDGVVMEIGTGPGTNFKCWNSTSSHTIIK